MWGWVASLPPASAGAWGLRLRGTCLLCGHQAGAARHLRRQLLVLVALLVTVKPATFFFLPAPCRSRSDPVVWGAVRKKGTLQVV